MHLLPVSVLTVVIAAYLEPVSGGECIFYNQEYEWNVGESYRAASPWKCYQYCDSELFKKTTSSSTHPTAWVFQYSRGKKGGVGDSVGSYRNCYCQRHVENKESKENKENKDARKAVTGGRKTVGGYVPDDGMLLVPCSYEIMTLPDKLGYVGKCIYYNQEYTKWSSGSIGKPNYTAKTPKDCYEYCKEVESATAWLFQYSRAKGKGKKGGKNKVCFCQRQVKDEKLVAVRHGLKTVGGDLEAAGPKGAEYCQDKISYLKVAKAEE